MVYNNGKLKNALEDEDYELAQLLLGDYAIENDGWTPLHAAVAAKAPVDLIEFIAQNQAPSINTQDGDGHTPLHLACMQGRPGVIRTLIEDGATPAIEDAWGRTPVHEAVISKEPAVVKVVASRADNNTVNKESKRHNTPLDLASDRGISYVRQALLNHGATQNSKTLA